MTATPTPLRDTIGHMRDIADVAERYTVEELRDVLREKADELEAALSARGAAGAARPHCEDCCGSGRDFDESDEACRACHGTGDAPSARYWREDAHYWRERACALRAALEPFVDFPEDTFTLGPQDTFTMTVLGFNLHDAREAIENAGNIATPPAASGEAAPNMQKCAGCGSEWPDYLFKDGKCIKCRKTTPPASGEAGADDLLEIYPGDYVPVQVPAGWRPTTLRYETVGDAMRVSMSEADFNEIRRLAAVAPAGMEAVTEEMLARAHAGFDAAVTEWNEQQLGERGINIGDYAMRGALTAALAARTGKGEANG